MESQVIQKSGGANIIIRTNYLNTILQHEMISVVVNLNVLNDLLFEYLKKCEEYSKNIGGEDVKTN